MSHERWYEFTQVEVVRRPFFVKAETLAEARQMVRENPAGWDGEDGVSDLGPNTPDDIRVVGPGCLADQDLAEWMARERRNG